MHIKFKICDGSLSISTSQLKCKFINRNELSETLQSLREVLKKITPQDLLLTLPSSKNQFRDESVNYNGYTEYLRKHFNSAELSMGFYYEDTLFNLITDHIPLKDVTSNITVDIIVKKTQKAIVGYLNYFSQIEEVYFSGINPHAGEGGLLGEEEALIESAKKKLESLYPDIKFKGPISGDIIIKNKKPNTTQIFTFFHHDQGLGIFKAMNQYYGINITFGLPFIRMSVDHGTAFDLYAKNKANPTGCLYLLNTANKLYKKYEKTNDKN